MPKLRETQIKSAKPKEKVYKLFDGDGLYLEIRPTGKKIWRLKYRLNGKDKTYTIGDYPYVTLQKARKKAFELKVTLFENKSLNNLKSFKEVAEEFLKIKKSEWSENHLKAQKAKLDNYVFDLIGEKKIEEISKSDINDVLENIVKKSITNSKSGDKIELRKKIFLLIRQILRYAVHKDYIKYNVCDSIDISQILPKKKEKHIEAILDEKEFKQMVDALFNLNGVYKISLLALKFLILTALRSGNVRKMRWDWVNFDEKILIIPAEEMKNKKEFRLPLTNSLLEILKEAKKMKRSKYVFYSPADKNKPLSENIFIVMLKRAGIENHKPHGFRSSFSTFAYKYQRVHSFSSEIIETQLAHVIGNKVTRAYMRSDFLEERRKLLEWWEGFLEG